MPASDTRHQVGRGVAAAIAAVLLAVALLTTGVSRLTAHASGPTVSAAPSSGLEDGEFITLSISGFTPSSTLSFAQCSGTPATVATDCTPINPYAGNNGGVHLNGSGAGRASMPVYEGPDPSLENQAQNGHLACDANHNCTIVAFTSAPPSLSGAVVVPIAFAPSPELCPPASSVGAAGAGAAAAQAAMYRWESSACLPPQSLSVAYTASNSPDGVGSFTGGAGTNRYAISGPWAPADAPTATGSPAQTWTYAPLANSAVVVAFLAFDQKSGAQINHLTLTPDLLAQLFAGSLPAFNTNPQVTALNPAHHLPTSARGFARSEHDSETWEFTSWLSQTAASWVWPGGPNAGQPIGATDTWPSAGTATALSSGSVAEMMGMIGQSHAAGTGSALFALTDASTAAFYGLPTVGIVRADGSVTTASVATVTQALQDGTPNADGTVTPNYTTSDPSAWPMPMPLYALAPTNNVSSAAATTLAGFLHYVAGAGQSALPGGYAPLTSSEIAQTTSAAGAIPTSGTGGDTGTDSSGATGIDDSSDATDSSLADSSDIAPGFDDSSVTDSSSDTSDSADSFDSSTGDTSDTGDSGDGSDAAVGSAAAASIVLPLGGDGFAPVLPAIAGAAGLSLLIGAGLEGQRRIRRFLAKRGDSGSH